MKMKSSKRIIALVVSLALVISTFAGLSLTSSAAEPGWVWYPAEDGYSLVNCSAVDYADYTKFTVSAADDANVYPGTVAGGLTAGGLSALNATNLKYMIIRYRTSGVTNPSGIGVNGFNGYQGFSYNANGTWQDTVVDLTATANWTGSHEWFRWEPWEGLATGTIDVAFMAFFTSSDDATTWAATQAMPTGTTPVVKPSWIWEPATDSYVLNSATAVNNTGYTTFTVTADDPYAWPGTVPGGVSTTVGLLNADNAKYMLIRYKTSTAGDSAGFMYSVNTQTAPSIKTFAYETTDGTWADQIVDFSDAENFTGSKDFIRYEIWNGLSSGSIDVAFIAFFASESDAETYSAANLMPDGTGGDNTGGDNTGGDNTGGSDLSGNGDGAIVGPSYSADDVDAYINFTNINSGLWVEHTSVLFTPAYTGSITGRYHNTLLCTFNEILRGYVVTERVNVGADHNLTVGANQIIIDANGNGITDNQTGWDAVAVGSVIYLEKVDMENGTLKSGARAAIVNDVTIPTVGIVPSADVILLGDGNDYDLSAKVFGAPTYESWIGIYNKEKIDANGGLETSTSFNAVGHNGWWYVCEGSTPPSEPAADGTVVDLSHGTWIGNNYYRDNGDGTEYLEGEYYLILFHNDGLNQYLDATDRTVMAYHVINFTRDANDLLPAPETYSVTVGTVSNGTVEVDKTTGVEGDTITVTATADTGYELSQILVNGSPITGNTFTLAGDSVVTATFTLIGDGNDDNLGGGDDNLGGGDDNLGGDDELGGDDNVQTNDVVAIAVMSVLAVLALAAVVLKKKRVF